MTTPDPATAPHVNNPDGSTQEQPPKIRTGPIPDRHPWLTEAMEAFAVDGTKALAALLHGDAAPARTLVGVLFGALDAIGGDAELAATVNRVFKAFGFDPVAARRPEHVRQLEVQMARADAYLGFFRRAGAPTDDPAHVQKLLDRAGATEQASAAADNDERSGFMEGVQAALQHAPALMKAMGLEPRPQPPLGHGVAVPAGHAHEHVVGGSTTMLAHLLTHLHGDQGAGVHSTAAQMMLWWLYDHGFFDIADDTDGNPMMLAPEEGGQEAAWLAVVEWARKRRDHEAPAKDDADPEEGGRL